MAKTEKLVYTDSTAKRDLDARLKDNSPPPVFNKSENPSYDDENGFVGVSPEYANFANDTDKPLAAESGPEKQAEDDFLDGGASATKVPADAKEARDKVTREDVPGA